MRQNLKILILVQAALAVCLGAQAVMADRSSGHYEAIPERNVFKLKGLPEATAPAVQTTPLSKLFLTGITTILGAKRALLKEQPSAGKPANPAQEQSFILAEGQREGGIEVLQIDEKAGKVKVNNSGAVQTLTFEKDGVKAPAGVTPPAAPPPLPTMFANPVGPGLGRHTLPSRTSRWPGADNSSAAAATATPPNSANALSGVPATPGAPTPTGTLSGAPEAVGTAPTAAEIESQLQPDLNLEQQLMLDFQQEAQQNGAALPGTLPTSAPPAASSSAPQGNLPVTQPPGGVNNSSAVFAQ